MIFLLLQGKMKNMKKNSKSNQSGNNARTFFDRNETFAAVRSSQATKIFLWMFVSMLLIGLIPAIVPSLPIYGSNTYQTEVITYTPGPDGKTVTETVRRYIGPPIDLQNPDTWGEQSEIGRVFNRAKQEITQANCDICVAFSTYNTLSDRYSSSSVHHTVYIVQNTPAYEFVLVSSEKAPYSVETLARGEMRQFYVYNTERLLRFDVKKDGKTVGSLEIALDEKETFSNNYFLKIVSAGSDVFNVKFCNYSYNDDVFF